VNGATGTAGAVGATGVTASLPVIKYETTTTAATIRTSFKEKESQEIECPTGFTVVGGGVQWVTVGVGSVVTESAPVKASKGWRVEMIQTFVSTGSKSTTGTFKVWAICSHP
jgi:hypothetical protein